MTGTEALAWESIFKPPLLGGFRPRWLKIAFSSYRKEAALKWSFPSSGCFTCLEWRGEWEDGEPGVGGKWEDGELEVGEEWEDGKPADEVTSGMVCPFCFSAVGAGEHSVTLLALLSGRRGSNGWRKGTSWICMRGRRNNAGRSERRRRAWPDELPSRLGMRQGRCGLA